MDFRGKNMRTEAGELGTKDSVVGGSTRGPAESAGQNSLGVPYVLRSVGNLALQRFLHARPAEAKLKVGAAGDKYEREAEQVAKEVMEPRSYVPIISSLRESPGGNSQALQMKAISSQNYGVAGLEAGMRISRGGGQPLSPSLRAFFEPRFGRDLGHVRLHTDTRAAESARDIHARAFTRGPDIAFAAGKYQPEGSAGQKLLAHELAHTLQQRGSDLSIIQGDFESDFAGRVEVPAEPGTPQPPNTVRLETYGTQTEPPRVVYAPYGVYSPGEVPDTYQNRIMTSGKAYQWRSPDVPVAEAFQIEMQRLENIGELTVGDMRTLAEGPGGGMNIRVMMAKVGNDYRFVGYDMSQVIGGAVTGGFVESEQGTAGVGRVLFADRVVRALRNGASGMHLEVYKSQRTQDFHTRVFAVTGRQGTPTEGMHYELTTREMILLALSWNERLTDNERYELGILSTRPEVTAAEAQRVLTSGRVVRPAGTQYVPSGTIVTGKTGPTGGPVPTGGGPATGGGGPAPEPSIGAEYTAANGRLQRLLGARETLRIWRPLVDAQGNEQKIAMDEEMARLDTSINDLAQRLAASQAAARVRSAGRAAPAAATAREAAYQESLKSLAIVTPSETSIGEQGFRALEELRQRPIEQVPIQIALGEARAGKYSDQAFRYMLSQIDPAARDSILYGPRGGLRPRNVQFERLTAYYGFSSGTLPSGETVSLKGISGGRLAVTRGAAGVLLLVEAANLANQVYTSYKLGHETMRRKNLYPFIRRLLFWDRLGAHPAVVGVDDDFFQWSPDYERDYDKAVKGLEDWDAFFIEDTPERPCLSDIDILHIAAHLAYYVRNYDEFATLFRSSGQDAVKWESDPIWGWERAKWYVRVGYYDTSWQNTVEQRWVYHEKLTQVMNVMAKRIIANTEELLRLQAQGVALPGEESRLGGFYASSPPAGAKKARLRDKMEKTTVYTVRMREDYTRDQGSRLAREVTWWSPPVFYVHEYTHMGFATVSGADYNTYAVLRGLSLELYRVSAGEGGERTTTYLAENEEAIVEIPWLLLDIDK